MIRQTWWRTLGALKTWLSERDRYTRLLDRYTKFLRQYTLCMKDPYNISQAQPGKYKICAMHSPQKEMSFRPLDLVPPPLIVHAKLETIRLSQELPMCVAPCTTHILMPPGTVKPAHINELGRQSIRARAGKTCRQHKLACYCPRHSSWRSEPRMLGPYYVTLPTCCTHWVACATTMLGMRMNT